VLDILWHVMSNAVIGNQTLERRVWEIGWDENVLSGMYGIYKY